jgi:uncharacterized protein YidB (DUF937 family)
MDSKLKKLVAGVAIAGALTVGTAGVAVAADGSGGTATDPATTNQPAQVGKRHPWLRHQLRKAAVGVVTDTLGVSRQELREALKGGQTLSQYATSLGKDPQTVVDALTNAANTKLDQLVADGTITQERADTVKGKLPARIDRLMNRQWGQHATA